MVGQITPWNYPLMMADLEDRAGAGGGQHGRAQAGGDDAGHHAQLAELAAEILPPGVLNVITGHGEPAGAALVTHPDVDMVSLTGLARPPASGSPQAAADTLKRVHLELGGKAPVVVFDDVDMETALETIAGTGYYNAGQDCTAATRVLAGASVYDDVVAGLAEQAEGAGGGRHAARPTPTLGPLNSCASASGSRASSSARPSTPRS